MNRFSKWLLRSLAFVFMLLVFLLGAIAIVLNTESGSRFALQRVSAVTDGALTFSDIKGTLWRTLRVGQLRYGNADLEVLISNVEIVFHWPSLATGSVSVDRLEADEVLYRKLKASDPEPTPLEVAMPPLPVVIAVDVLQLGRFVMPLEDSEFLITDIAATNTLIAGSRIRAGSAGAAFSDTIISLTDADVDLSGPVPIEAALSWRREDGSYAGDGVIRGTLTEALLAHSLRVPNLVQTEGTLRLQGRIDPQFDLRTVWERFVIAGAELTRGDVTVRGTTSAYDADITVTIAEPRIPEVSVVGTASGDLQGFSSADLRLDSAAGKVTVNGDLAWLPALTANLDVQAEDVDPSLLSEEVTGLLDATARLVYAAPDDWQVSDIDASGTLNGAGIVAEGTVTMTPELIQCDSCELLLGENRLTADGTYGGDRVALDIDIDAPDLNAAWAELNGALFVAGRLDGELRAPRFAGTGTGSKLRFRDWSAGSIDIESRGSGSERVDLTLAVNELFMGETDLGSLQGALNGTLQNIDVEVEWSLFELEITAAANVQRSADSITALLNRAAVTEQYTGRWVLAAPVAIRQQDSVLTVDAHRWLLPDGMVDVQSIRVGADETVIKANLDALPLSIANAFMPEFYRLAGIVNAEIDMARSNGQWLGTLHWSQTDTVLQLARPGEAVIDLNIPQVDADATLADGGAVVAAALRIDPGVTAQLDFSMDALERSSPVDARLQVEGQEWGWISSFVPAIDDFGGRIAVNLAATGPIASPALSGEASWRNGSIVVPFLNVPFSNINLVASGEAGGIATISGSASAGEGSLNFDGRIDEIMQSSRRLELGITGSAAEVVNWPEYHVWVSPDLTLQASAGGILVKGNVNVPRAEIVIRERPENAVGVSSDIRVVDEVVEEREYTQVSLETRMILGDNIHVSAFGLDTRLNGELLVRQQPGQAMTANGRIGLIDGAFVAYGQRLTIEEGNLIFTGPIDNPVVDVRAVRKIDNFDQNVTAGIQLRGRANSLSSTIYSDPSMSEANALSYLIIGRPLSEASSSEGGQLSGAAVGLGLRQASRITQQIGQSFGLDQLDITGDGGDATALVAGKQINERLYARYAYGVFSRIGMVILRYRLSERISLEAGAGENQSIDILYSVEQQ